MSTRITVRDIDSADESGLGREAPQTGVSMEDRSAAWSTRNAPRTDFRPKPSRPSLGISGWIMASSFRLPSVAATSRCRSPTGRRNDRPACVAAGHQCLLRDDAAAARAACRRLSGFHCRRRSRLASTTVREILDGIAASIPARSGVNSPGSGYSIHHRAWSEVPQRATCRVSAPSLINDSAGMPSSRCRSRIILRLSDRLRFNTS